MQNQYALDGLSLKRAFDGEPRGGSSLPFTVAQDGVFASSGVRAVGPGSSTGPRCGWVGEHRYAARRNEGARIGVFPAAQQRYWRGESVRDQHALQQRFSHYGAGGSRSTFVSSLAGLLEAGCLAVTVRAACLRLHCGRGSTPQLSSDLVTERSELLQPCLRSRWLCSPTAASTPTATAKALSFLEWALKARSRGVPMNSRCCPASTGRPAKRGSLALEWARVCAFVRLRGQRKRVGGAGRPGQLWRPDHAHRFSAPALGLRRCHHALAGRGARAVQPRRGLRGRFLAPLVI